MIGPCLTARNFARALAILLALACPFLAFARDAAQGPACELAAGGALPPAKKVSQQSSVELEIGAADLVLGMMTTATGTIRAVWPEDRPIDQFPSKLRESIQGAYPEMPLLDAPWDVLTPREQREILMAAAPQDGDAFFNDRKVRGLKYKDKIVLTFAKLTRFAGKIYPRGTHTIPAAEIFGNTAIEYMGPERMSQNLGFELHIRSYFTAGDNLLTARALSLALTGAVGPLHLHIVGPYPGPIGQLETLRMAAAYQNWMMIHDLLLMERKGAIEWGDKGFYPYDMAAVAQLMLSGRIAASWEKLDEVFSKNGTIGIRSHHFYDENVWGIESRYLSPQISDERLFLMLNQIQQKMISGELTSSRERARGYIRDYLVYKTSNPIMSGINHTYVPAADVDRLVAAYKANAMVLYLFANFEGNYEFFDKPQLLAQIEQAQIDCWALLKHGMKSTDVMEIFARKSGLRRYFQQQYPGVLP